MYADVVAGQSGYLVSLGTSHRIEKYWATHVRPSLVRLCKFLLSSRLPGKGRDNSNISGMTSDKIRNTCEADQWESGYHRRTGSWPIRLLGPVGSQMSLEALDGGGCAHQTVAPDLCLLRHSCSPPTCTGSCIQFVGRL